MCKFFSFLALRNGDLVCDDATDSHEDLIALRGLDDSGYPLASRQWFRGEFLPPEDLARIEDPAAWTVRVDENAVPEWYDEDHWRSECWLRVERMFVRDERKILTGGKYVLLPGSRVHRVVGGLVRIACTNADLTNADLRGANLRGAGLRTANLRGADLGNADLGGSLWEGADPPAGWVVVDGRLEKGPANA